MNTAIQVEGLSKVYRRTLAVDHVSFTIPTGSVVGFLGPNGAGKSTTIRMLMGLMRPSAGSSSLLGYDSQSLPAPIWSRVGYVGEDQGLYDWMTVRHLIHFTSHFYPNWDFKYADELIRKLELPTGNKIKELSKGQKGKVSLLLALSFHPELLILDDPVSGLDPIVRREFLEHVIELLQLERRTVLFSSHILDEVERIADHVLIIRHGQLLVNRPLDDLKATVKQVTMIFHKAVPAVTIPDTLRFERADHHITFTVKKFSKDHLKTWKAFKPKKIETKDLTLSEIFYEYIKGEQGGMRS